MRFQPAAEAGTSREWRVKPTPTPGGRFIVFDIRRVGGSVSWKRHYFGSKEAAENYAETQRRACDHGF